MLIGIGLDIEARSRFERILRFRRGLIPQIFSQRECHINNALSDPAMAYTAGFAIKEAAFKALGSSWTESALFWKDIECLDLTESGPCDIALSGTASRWGEERNVLDLMATVKVSATHVIAQVWLLGADIPGSAFREPGQL